MFPHHNQSTGRSGLATAQFSRRKLLAAGLLAASAPLLQGCFGGNAGASGAVYDQPSGQVPAQFKDRQRVVLWSNFTENNAAVLQKNIDSFNESQEAIFAEVQIFDGYSNVESKLTASLQARQVPDISILGDSVWNRFYLNDILEPLDGYFDSSFGADAFHEQFVAEGTVKDQVWWLPFGRSTPLFYYNREIFEAVGLPDRAPATFTEYRDWGKEVRGYKYKGTDVRMRAYNGNDDWYFQGSSWAFGGGYSDGLDMKFTSEGTLASLEFDRAFIHDDKLGYLATDPSADFIAGAAATMFNSTGTLTGVGKSAKFDFGCGFLPKEVNTGVPTGGGGISMFHNASEDRKKAAWEVIKFLSTGDAVVQWTLGTGYMPTARDAVESAEVKAKAKDNPNFQVAIDQLEIAQVPDVVRRYIPETVPELNNVIQKVYAGGEDPKTVLATAQKNLEAAVEKIRPKFEEKVGN